MDMVSSWKDLAPLKRATGKKINLEVTIHNMTMGHPRSLKMITASRT
jgi:hypothetical protein